MLLLYFALLLVGVTLFTLSFAAPFQVAALMRKRYPQHWQIVAESAHGKLGWFRLWVRMQYVLRSPALLALDDRAVLRWRRVWRFGLLAGWVCWLAALAIRLHYAG